MLTSNSRTLPVEIRMADDNASHLIRDSWLKSFRKSSWTQGIPNEIFYPRYGERVDKLIKSSITMVAFWEQDHDQFYGWMTGSRFKSGLIIHYCYVKSAFRKLGMGRALLESFAWKDNEKIIGTHHTWAHQWLDCKYVIEYNPYIISDIIGG